MDTLTPEGRRIVEDVARRHGLGSDAVLAVLVALVEGRGVQAQFSHPDLGGMGQWSQGGMIMVGDMFNQGLKARVDALCIELASLIRSTEMVAAPVPRQSQSQSQGAAGAVSLFVAGNHAGVSGWPAELGTPAAVGGQNDLRYAYFPDTGRLAIDLGGRITIYDTGDHRIAGFSQQQGGDRSLTFTSQHGVVRVADLPLIVPGEAAAAAPRQAPPDPSAPPPEATTSPASDDIFAKLERLADLRRKDILTEQEFEAKKAELLSRL